jgi:uracil-DNA glycosylase
MNKLLELQKLVNKRREKSAGTVQSYYTRNYSKLGDFHEGVYDFDDHVVPYSKSAFNLNAKIMIILQDWASVNFLNKPVDEIQVKFGHDPKLPTNKNLFNLLTKFFNVSFEETYSTDVFPFIKSGDMGTPIPMKDMTQAAKHFVIPQIKIISPKIVVCLGSRTLNSIRKASGLKEVLISEPLEKMQFSIGNSVVVGAHHVGGLGTSRLGGKKAQEKQWGKLATFYKNL